ncbi:MAG: DUF1566 domain-containing protein [Phycisphaera sp.]|nr:DUF1566 domain-containing protein [Phycisphaera sp.]
MKRKPTSAVCVCLSVLGTSVCVYAQVYRVVDTGQDRCYDDHTEVRYPQPGQAYSGQDAQYRGNEPSYRDNGDGTVTDLNTGLMWQADPGSKKSYAQAVAGVAACDTGGYHDWRLPTIKELYSLILFTGTDPDPRSQNASSQTPFIDTHHFKFRYGNPADGDRVIDSQWATSTLYVGKVMHGQQAMFGVNFADGRIKGYPVGQDPRGRTKTFYVLYVRDNPAYGRNDFVDNGDGTVTDRATGLMWMRVDSASLKAGRNHDGKLNWPEALAWAEDLDYAGHDDWRLPNAKELHSIVDYTRSPDTTRSAAIDPIFEASPITNEGGQTDFGQYWTSTSHCQVNSATQAVYIAFGRALGFMAPPGSQNGAKQLLDVHGAGAQRADFKTGDPSKIPQGRGPQGDVMRIVNLVRCVRGGEAQPRTSGPAVAMVYREHPQMPDDQGGQLGRADQGQPADQPGNRNTAAPSGDDWVRRLDRDKDNKVSRKEFDGPSDHFNDFDRNHDGYITAEEAPSHPPMRGR